VKIRGDFMIKKLHWLIVVLLSLFLLLVPEIASANDKTGSSHKMNNAIVLSYKGKNYQVKTENNKTVKALSARLPLKMKMKELNGNERYHYLKKGLPSNDKAVHYIHKGDVMLYNANCIVVFYKSFKTSYKYTRIGHVEHFSSTANKLGKGQVTITLKKQD
jgi:hypothetical protein